MKAYSNGTLLWDNIKAANNPYTRFKGLMGKHRLLEGEGILIKPCNQVHTFHMRFDLDVLFISKDMQVLHISTLQPGKVSPKIRDAAFVLEVAANSAQDLEIIPGDILKFE